MSIPKFLMKFHHWIKSTRAWKHRWKIIAFSPFGFAGLLIFALFFFQTMVRKSAIRDAQNAYSQLTSKWDSLGESADVHDYFPSNIATEDDFLAHSAIRDEIDEKNSPPLILLWETSGFSSDYSVYVSKDAHNGKLCDITQWLDPLQPTWNKQQCASHCLTLLQPFKARLDAIADASRCKEASFIPPTDESDSILTQFNTLKAAADLLGYRAVLNIHAGNPAKALQDILTMHRITLHYQQYPCLLGLTLQTLHYATLEHAIIHGLNARCWNEQELQLLSLALDQTDLQKSTFSALRGEVSFFIHIADDIMSDLKKETSSSLEFSLPDDYNLSNLKSYYQSKKEECAPEAFGMLEHTTTVIDLIDKILYPGGKTNTSLTPFLSTYTPTKRESYYPNIVKSVSLHIASSQILRTAVALERHRLRHGIHPKSLHPLTPDFLPSIPTDIYTAKPISFKNQPNGSLLIWSVGTDIHDDGGDLDLDHCLTIKP